MNGKTYPETVLFRVATAQRAPLMKLTVSEDGSALGLSDNSQPPNNGTHPTPCHDAFNESSVPAGDAER